MKKIILAFFFISSILSSQDIDFNNIKIDDVKNIIKNVLNKNVQNKMSTAPCIPRRSPIQVLTWLNVA